MSDIDQVFDDLSTADLDRLMSKDELVMLVKRHVKVEQSQRAELARLREELRLEREAADEKTLELAGLREERECEGKVLRSMQKERNDAEHEAARLREELLKAREEAQYLRRRLLKETE